MALGEPDVSGRRRPVATGATETMHADLVIMALGNASNPIIKDSEPELHATTWGTIDLEHAGSQETSLPGVYSGGDAARGGSTAINAAGDGQAAAREIIGHVDVACIDGPEIDAHIIDWDTFLPRFGQFRAQEQESRVRHGLA